MPLTDRFWPIAAVDDQQQFADLCRSWSRSVLVKMQSGGQMMIDFAHSKALKVRGWQKSPASNE